MEELQKHFENYVNELLYSSNNIRIYLNLDVFYAYKEMCNDRKFIKYLNLIKPKNPISTISNFFIINETGITAFKNMYYEIISSYANSKKYSEAKLKSYGLFVTLIINMIYIYIDYYLINKPSNSQNPEFFSDLLQEVVNTVIIQYIPSFSDFSNCLLNFDIENIPDEIYDKLKNL